MEIFSSITNAIDCSHFINDGIPVFPGDKSFNKIIINNYCQYGYKSESFEMSCGIGTHMDSPHHFYEDGRTITDIPINELICPAVIIDVVEKVENDNDYELSLDDLREWESKYGKVKDNSVVIMKTGWSLRFNDKELYYNKDNEGVMHFPGFSEELASFLIKERNINGIGIDTLSLDRGKSDDFNVHKIILGAGKYQIENLNLSSDKIKENGGTIIVLPLKIENASESPVRAVILY